MANIKEQNTRTANRCKIRIAGETIAEGTGFNMQESGGAQGMYVVGSPYPYEHQHTQYRAQGSISRLVWLDRAVKKFDLTTNLLNVPVFDIVALEGPEGQETVLFTMKGCTITDRSVAINANNPIQSNVSVQGLRMLPTDPKDIPIGN